MQPLRIGVVGCGEAAQVLHLPALTELTDLFRVVALCDVSRSVVEALASRTPRATAFCDYRELVARADVDVVLVSNPHVYHAEVTLAALAQGKHVLVEKPLCVSLSELDSIEGLARRKDLVVQVGYMRRYAEAFLQAAQEVGKRHPSIRFARFHDIVGRNATIVADAAAVVRPDDLPQQLAEQTAEFERLRYAQVIGSDKPALVKTYGQLLGLVSHDISAMRELLGRPHRVLHAWQSCEGVYLGATFDFGDFVAEVTSGVDNVPRYDTYFEVFAADLVIRVDFSPPYIRHVPAQLTVTRQSGPSGVETSTSFASRADLFAAEWRAFYEAVRTGTSPKTSIADSREDLELFAEFMKFLK
jgi:predicted dehydrogenase